MIRNRKRLWALFLSAALIVTQLPAVAMAENNAPEDGSIASFEPLDSGVAKQTVDVGTELSGLTLPDSVMATVYHVTEDTVIPDEDNTEDDSGDPSTATPSEADESVSGNNAGDSSAKDSGETVMTVITSTEEISVTWHSEPAVYDGNAEGSYLFKAVVDGYVLSSGVKPPQIVVTVTADTLENPMEIQPEKPSPCTRAEGCALGDGHEGECVMERPSANGTLARTISGWTFVATDYSDYMGSQLAIPGVNVNHQADFGTVVSMLPTQISAEIKGEAPDTLDLIGWSCAEYLRDSEGNWPFTGDYIFTASLPEGYVCNPLPTVKVTLGGASTYAANNCITEGNLTVTASNNGEVEYIAGNGFVLKTNGDYEVSGEWIGTLTDLNTIRTKAVITIPPNVTANVTLNGAAINVSGQDYACAFKVEANGTANITLSGANALKSGRSRAGLEALANANMTLDGSGRLEAIGGFGGTGIGAGCSSNSADITITDGSILAKGGDQGAGIGTSRNGRCDDIIITGGNIEAEGGDKGAGIGTGFSGSCNDIRISGAVITAEGGPGGAGIGCGVNGTGGDINITGGTITAIGNLMDGSGNIGNYSDSWHHTPTSTIIDGSVSVKAGREGEGLYNTNGAVDRSGKSLYSFPLPLDDLKGLSRIKTVSGSGESTSWDISKTHDPLENHKIYMWMHGEDQEVKVTYDDGLQDIHRLVFYPDAGVWRIAGEPAPPPAVVPIPPSYTIFARPETLDFGSKTVDDTDVPGARTVTITNSGNSPITGYTVSGNTNFDVTYASSAIPARGTATFTVQPKTGLAANTYEETLTIQTAESSSATVNVKFVVEDTYTVTFELAGGARTGGGELIQTVPSGRAAVAPAVTRNGHTFIGWDKDFSRMTADMTVTAQWKENRATGGGFASGGGSDSESEPQSSYTAEGDKISQTISLSDLKKLADNGKSLTLGCGKASMTFDSAALRAILEAVPSTAGNITFAAAPADLSTFPDAAKLFGAHPVYDFTISYKDSNGNLVTVPVNFPAGSAAITLNYTPAAGEVTGSLFMVYVDGRGAVTWLDKSSYDSGRMLAEAPHFSTYGVAYKAPAPVFTDITGHWAKEDIEFMAARGLLSGTGNGLFSPDGTMTRGMFVTSLGRLAGVNPDSYQTRSFTDVKADACYAAYVEWAAQKNIVKGTGDKLFSPGAPVTREQMAVMLMNYARQMGYSIPTPLTAITFADGNKISGWAAKEVAAMQRAGIVKGKDGNRFDPQENATRAEGSAVLRRFVEIVIDPSTASGWVKNDSGHWLYYKGGTALTGWQTIGRLRYYFNADGVMHEGWKEDTSTGKWYYLTNAGAATGWRKIGGEWYYFDDNGVMAVNIQTT